MAREGIKKQKPEWYSSYENQILGKKRHSFQILDPVRNSSHKHLQSSSEAESLWLYQIPLAGVGVEWENVCEVRSDTLTILHMIELTDTFLQS